MIYMKHPDLGNKYFPEEKQAELESNGWVRWPRTQAQKRGLPVSQEVVASSPDASFSEKRKPGRPRKT